MKWKDLSLKERKQIYDSVRANNPDATYLDIKQQFDSIPAYQDGKGKTINKADLPPEYRTGTPEYFERQRKISGAVNTVQPEAYITPAGYIKDAVNFIEDLGKGDYTGAAIDAASPHKPRLKNIKLGGIGMTFSNLKKREENQRRLHSPYDDTNEEKATITGDQNEFTQEQVEATWFSMCMRMQNKLDFIGLANRMKSIVPKITNYPQIEVIINNQLLLDDVLNIKNRILKTFVLGLHNSELSISYRLADQEEVGKVLTKNEVLELLMEKNPAMKKLTKDLDLVMT